MGAAPPDSPKSRADAASGERVAASAPHADDGPTARAALAEHGAPSTPAPPRPEREAFVLGLNAPWVDCGWDFGPAPPGWDPEGTRRAGWRGRMRARVREASSLGLPLLRWFVLANGANLAPLPRWDVGVARWRWEAAPLPEGFYADLDALLDTCAEEGVRLLPSLTSFGLFARGASPPTPGAIVSRGVPGLRAAALTDPDARAAFDERVIAPLVRVLAARASRLHAVEIVNEPEWITRGALRGGRPDAEVPLPAMLDFVRVHAAGLRAAGLTATVGFVRDATRRAWDALSRLAYGEGLGLGLGQVHHYPGPRERLPLHDPRGGPCLVGELATRFDVLPGWPELGAADALAERLAHIEASGYAGALLWSAQPRDGSGWPDRATRWDDATRAALRAITGVGR